VSLKRLLAFGAVYLIWGSTYLGIRIGVETLPPFLLAGSRGVLAGGLLFVWLRLRGVPAPALSEWGRASLAGVLMLSLGNGLVTWAETHVSSALAALLIAATPLFVALLDWWRPGGRRPTRAASAGIALGAAGMLLLVQPDASSVAASHTLGVLAVLVGGWTWALGILYLRYRKGARHTALFGAQQMLAGGAVLLVVSLARGELHSLEMASVSARSLLALGYLTIFGSLLAFSAYNWLATNTTPSGLSTTAYVNPVVALILGTLVLGERLPWFSLAGAALILGAVIVMSWQSPAKRPA
jgi:drug/metabolite transporter (DMT)-like permease